MLCSISKIRQSTLGNRTGLKSSLFLISLDLLLFIFVRKKELRKCSVLNAKTIKRNGRTNQSTVIQFFFFIALKPKAILILAIVQVLLGIAFPNITIHCGFALFQILRLYLQLTHSVCLIDILLWQYSNE